MKKGDRERERGRRIVLEGFEGFFLSLLPHYSESSCVELTERLGRTRVRRREGGGVSLSLCVCERQQRREGEMYLSAGDTRPQHQQQQRHEHEQMERERFGADGHVRSSVNVSKLPSRSGMPPTLRSLTVSRLYNIGSGGSSSSYDDVRQLRFSGGSFNGNQSEDSPASAGSGASIGSSAGSGDTSSLASPISSRGWSPRSCGLQGSPLRHGRASPRAVDIVRSAREELEARERSPARTHRQFGNAVAGPLGTQLHHHGLHSGMQQQQQQQAAELPPLPKAAMSTLEAMRTETFMLRRRVLSAPTSQDRLRLGAAGARGGGREGGGHNRDGMDTNEHDDDEEDVEEEDMRRARNWKKSTQQQQKHGTSASSSVHSTNDTDDRKSHEMSSVPSPSTSAAATLKGASYRRRSVGDKPLTTRRRRSVSAGGGKSNLHATTAAAAGFEPRWSVPTPPTEPPQSSSRPVRHATRYSSPSEDGNDDDDDDNDDDDDDDNNGNKNTYPGRDENAVHVHTMTKDECDKMDDAIEGTQSLSSYSDERVGIGDTGDAVTAVFMKSEELHDKERGRRAHVQSEEDNPTAVLATVVATRISDDADIGGGITTRSIKRGNDTSEREDNTCHPTIEYCPASNEVTEKATNASQSSSLGTGREDGVRLQDVLDAMLCDDEETIPVSEAEKAKADPVVVIAVEASERIEALQRSRCSGDPFPVVGPEFGEHADESQQRETEEEQTHNGDVKKDKIVHDEAASREEAHCQRRHLEAETSSSSSSSARDHCTMLRCNQPMGVSGDIDWSRGELLGEGAYGKVYTGLNLRTGELMAVKCLNLHAESKRQEAQKYRLEELEREIAMYRRLRHDHIVSYLGAAKAEKEGVMYIFLEYISGGCIASMLRRFGRFNEELVRLYVREILLGLEYLHREKIIHRDLKGANILITRDGTVKLADFGASKAFPENTVTDANKSLHGSIFWMAPEVVTGAGYGRRADVWSLGCTVVEMLSGEHPWPDADNQWSAIFAIARTKTGPPIPQETSEQARDFLSQCFKIEPTERASASELLHHPFVAGTDRAIENARNNTNLNHSM